MIAKGECVKQGDLCGGEPEFRRLPPKSRAVQESERP